MYQSANPSTNGTENTGGVNAAQYGYGSLMGTISIDMAEVHQPMWAASRQPLTGMVFL